MKVVFNRELFNLAGLYVILCLCSAVFMQKLGKNKPFKMKAQIMLVFGESRILSSSEELALNAQPFFIQNLKSSYAEKRFKFVFFFLIPFIVAMEDYKSIAFSPIILD